jgi:hypothetical protein
MHDAAKSRAERSGVPFKGELHLIPESFTYLKKVYMCAHSTYQPDRVPTDMRKRYPAKTRYTGCTARVTAEAKRVRVEGSWVWGVVACQEVRHQEIYWLPWSCR